MGAGQTRQRPQHFDNPSAPDVLVFRSSGPSHPGAGASNPVAVSPPTNQGVRVPANNPLVVEGNAIASYARTVATATTAATYELNGTIQLYGIGKLDLLGTIEAVGVNQNHVAGQISLSTNTGTITLDLTHMGQTAPGAFPREMYFTVTHATGTYSHAGGEGIISFTASSAGPMTGSVSMSLT